MAFHPIENTVEAVIHGRLGGQEIINTFFIKKGGGYTSEDVQDLADFLDEWVGEEWLPIQGNDYTYERVTVRGMADALDFYASADDSSGNGTTGGNSQPNNVALAIARKTIYTGRAARGRIFITVPLSAMDDENHVTAAYATSVEGQLNDLNTTLTGMGWDMVVAHRRSGGAWLSTGVTFPVTGWEVTDLVVDSQRRRLPGRGS